MSRPLVVVGASGFGRESLDVVAAHNAARPDAAFEVLGVLDDGPSEDNRSDWLDETSHIWEGLTTSLRAMNRLPTSWRLVHPRCAGAWWPASTMQGGVPPAWCTLRPAWGP